jgi:hypothetical protein
MIASLFQVRLFENAVQRSGGQVVARFTRNRDSARLGRVFELAVTAALFTDTNRPCATA